MEHPITISENPRDEAFAVIRMDPVAMVRHLNDPEALRAAESLSPRSYLVYLFEPQFLPFRAPELPWHAFCIYPIGPCLRPADEDACITPQMCTPICPNNTHPEGREPLLTEPPFPFDNCYFWFDTTMKIRVFRRAEGFCWDEATELWPPVEYNRWQNFEGEDRLKQLRAEEARQPPPGTVPTPSSPTEDLVSQTLPLAPPVDEPLHAGNKSDATPYAEDATLCMDSDSVHSGSIAPSEDVTGSVDTFTNLIRLFADPQESPELQPIFHLWFDLAANLKQDEIPNPIHLFEERDEIVRIIREARARDPTLPLLPLPTDSCDSVESLGSSTPGDDSYSETTSIVAPLPAPNPRSSAASLARKWRAGSSAVKMKPKRRAFKLLRKVALRVQSLFRIPYIPVWP